jgi:hypothetical protein
LVSHNLIDVYCHDLSIIWQWQWWIDIFSYEYTNVNQYALSLEHLGNVDFPSITEHLLFGC